MDLPDVTRILRKGRAIESQYSFTQLLGFYAEILPLAVRTLPDLFELSKSATFNERMQAVEIVIQLAIELIKILLEQAGEKFLATLKMIFPALIK
jgi:hypothetical protein